MTTLEAHQNELFTGPSKIIRLIGGGLLLFLIWAGFARGDEIVRADGQVVSSSRSQIIQNLEGGILARLDVRQGDLVEAGQVLATLQDTKFRTNVTDLQDQVDALEIKRHRLEAELEGAFDFTVSDELSKRSPAVLASERALLDARQTDYASRRDGARAILVQAQDEYENMQQLLQDRIVAQLEVNRAKTAVSDAEIRYNEIANQSELERAEEYSRTVQDLSSRRQELRLAQDQLARTVITSPMRGVVNSMAVTTIGGVIRPGEEIFEVIPLGEELFVEARVRPENIASVERGQEATIKLTAYDYTIYGTLQGAVDFVSADTFEDERDARAEPFYKVTVRVDTSELTDRQQEIEIRPGMRAQTELKTGSKTILKYLLKPLYKSREALREP